MMQTEHDRGVSIDEKSFACEICWRRFARENDLKTHLWVHTQEKPYSCDLCHRAFPCQNSRNNHFKRTHKDANLNLLQQQGNNSASEAPVLPLIPAGSPPIQNNPSNNQLVPVQQQQHQQHLHHQHDHPLSPNSNQRKSSPPCDICGKTFAFKYYVKIHQTVHTKEKPYICDLCHKTFSQASSRNRHRKEMHKEDDSGGSAIQLNNPEGQDKLGQFDLGKAFVRGGSAGGGALYEVHPVPDTKEKPYSCDLCHKRFTQASSRNRHLKEMHKDGEAPVPGNLSAGRKAVGVLTRNVGPACAVCGKRFPCKSLLEIHMRVHTKERPYSCDICYKTFTQVSSRNFHRRKMHKELIVGSVSSPDQSPNPEQQNQAQQQQSQLVLKQNSMVDCGGKMVPQCSICGKRFPCKSLLEIHLRVHTKERPYSCDLCFKTFTQVSSRNFHRRKIHKDAIQMPPDHHANNSPPPSQQQQNVVVQQQQDIQQQQANPNNSNPVALITVQPSSQNVVVDDKSFHCKMCAAGGFTYK